MLSWIFGGSKVTKTRPRDGSPRQPPPSYEKAREVARRGTLPERVDLAANADLDPEILYYFASDQAPEVRREIAQNEGTPLQADILLARDVDEEVRQEIARKIGRLVPCLAEEENERLTAMALDVLEILAQDSLARVRAIVSEEIKRARNVPRHLVLRLAQDVEAIVAAPILEYSPLLSAHDLLAIIAGGVADGALIALARREDLAEPVAEAVVNFRDATAVKELLGNRSARIGDDTLDKIAIIATGVTDLHQPVVDRGDLPVRTIRRVAGFVSASLLAILIERNGLGEDLAAELRQLVRNRINEDAFFDDEPEGETAEMRARRMFEDGTLDESAVIEAVDANDSAFVRCALILLSRLPGGAVSRMLDAESGKAVVALAWKAGLGMRTAVRMQTRIARIQPKSVIKDDGGGNYPMSEDDLKWYVDYFAT